MPKLPLNLLKSSFFQNMDENSMHSCIYSFIILAYGQYGLHLQSKVVLLTLGINISINCVYLLTVTNKGYLQRGKVVS